MIAYNKTWLNNLEVQQQVYEEYEQGHISAGEWDATAKKYPVGFYTPNSLVRFGFFLLTVIIAVFSYGLFSLIFVLGLRGEANAFGGLCIFFGIACYVGLEIMIRNSHYQSGVDDALLWMGAVFIISGLNIVFNLSGLDNAIIIFIISLFSTLRYTDLLMTAAACLAFFAMVFFAYIRFGEFAKATTPFLLMIVTALVCFLASDQVKKQQWRYYVTCITLTRIIALVCFYCAGNYYVIREASNAMFHLNLQPGQSIPYGWVFWIFTVAVPVIYITRGIQKKDAILLRTGLILVAAVVFTVRYYYAVLPIETAMSIGGILLIGIAYATIKYLQQPKYGFTYEPSGKKDMMAELQVESLIIAEIFGHAQAPAAGDTSFGGGSGGGGGASGEF